MSIGIEPTIDEIDGDVGVLVFDRVQLLLACLWFRRWCGSLRLLSGPRILLVLVLAVGASGPIFAKEVPATLVIRLELEITFGWLLVRAVLVTGRCSLLEQ